MHLWTASFRENGRINRTRKRQLDFVGEIMREGVLEDLILTDHIYGKRARGKGRITPLSSLYKWLADQRLRIIIKIHILLRASKDREPWRLMIVTSSKDTSQRRGKEEIKEDRSEMNYEDCQIIGRWSCRCRDNFIFSSQVIMKSEY